MRFDVDYNLDICLKNEIIQIKECIFGILKVTDIYLFGSISKGMYSKYSDIDILALIDEDKSIRELKELRHFLEDKIEELGIERDVDLKLYTKRRFLELSLSPSFEQAITKDLIDIRRW